MKPLPYDKSALLEEATSLGLLGPNPSLEKPRAALLKCIHSSIKIGRSFKHVSILFVGTTGVGKSATINHLLGADYATTNKYVSETRSTKEFVVHGSDSKYAVEGLSLGLIDTPAFCDTDGLKQDACNLLSIQKFFRTHPTLSECYPNLILLFVNATDNRIMGVNSELRKSLWNIKQLGLVDPKNLNVVIVLTHACSIRKKNDEEWTKELNKRKSDVSRIVSDNLKVSAPVVLIENEHEDRNLERRGDNTVLPNGELQPKNLYEACASVLQTNDDGLGLITLNSIFAEPRKNEYRSITPGHECRAENARHNFLDSEDRAMHKLLEIVAKGGTLHHNGVVSVR